jgi:hypothetical protein
MTQALYAHMNNKIKKKERKMALSRFSVSCVSVFGTGGLSIPTLCVIINMFLNYLN